MKIVILDKNALGEDLSDQPLREFGEVVSYPSTQPAELDEHIGDADIIVVNKVKITAQAMKNAANLKLICEFATGYDNIDLHFAHENGIAVCNVPGYSTESVTLFTVATALALFSHLREYNDWVRDGCYSVSGVPNCLTPVYHEAAGMTWGIIGAGNIGMRVAQVAQSLGMRVIVNKRKPIAEYPCVDVDTLCRESDIISIHCPLTDETRGLIDARRLSLMKPTAVLVNEARGAVTDEYAVAAAIENGTIGAFGSDVYSAEPFGKEHPFYAVRNKKNVLLTPHAAWGAYESRVRCLRVICDNIRSYLAGEKRNRVE